MTARISIYVVTNRVNGKQYVGRTLKKPQARWSEHRASAKGGSPYWFHQALRKYGAESFDWDVVAVAMSPEEGKNAERTLVVQLQPAYNMTPGGEGPGVFSAETCAKISRALKGRKQSPELLAKLSAARKGKKQRPETIAKRSASMMGHVVSAATRAKRSAVNTGKKRDPEHAETCRANLSLARAQRWRLHRLKKAVSAFELDITTWP